MRAGDKPYFYQGTWENVPEFIPYAKCDLCYCEVPEKTLVKSGVFPDEMVCQECKKSIDEDNLNQQL